MLVLVWVLFAFIVWAVRHVSFAQVPEEPYNEDNDDEEEGDDDGKDEDDDEDGDTITEGDDTDKDDEKDEDGKSIDKDSLHPADNTIAEGNKAALEFIVGTCEWVNWCCAFWNCETWEFGCRSRCICWKDAQGKGYYLGLTPDCWCLLQVQHILAWNTIKDCAAVQGWNSA